LILPTRSRAKQDDVRLSTDQLQCASIPWREQHIPSISAYQIFWQQILLNQRVLSETLNMILQSLPVD
jgi:hypothetical protein